MPVSVLFKQTNTLAVFHLLCSMINEALQPFIPSTAHRDLLTVQYRDILRFIYGDSFPLLNTTKNDIVDFFHQKNVSWCARDLYDPGTVWTKDMEEQLETLKRLVSMPARTCRSFGAARATVASTLSLLHRRECPPSEARATRFARRVDTPKWCLPKN